MTRDSVRGRGAGPIERGSQLQAASLVAALIVAGIVLRFVVAWLYLPLSGLRVDVGDFAIWAHQLAQSGPGVELVGLHMAALTFGSVPAKGGTSEAR